HFVRERIVKRAQSRAPAIDFPDERGQCSAVFGGQSRAQTRVLGPDEERELREKVSSRGSARRYRLRIEFFHRTRHRIQKRPCVRFSGENPKARRSGLLDLLFEPRKERLPLPSH